jgi:hypothetical protein
MWLAQFVCAPQFFKTPKGLCGHTVFDLSRNGFVSERQETFDRLHISDTFSAPLFVVVIHYRQLTPNKPVFLIQYVARFVSQIRAGHLSVL